MSEICKNKIDLLSERMMQTGYEEMGKINADLSEEGLDQDRKDLESYEKYLVESE